jgi:hypothetical protein
VISSKREDAGVVLDLQGRTIFENRGEDHTRFSEIDAIDVTVVEF